MITLYHCAAARSFRPLWAPEELGLRYDLKMLPVPRRPAAGRTAPLSAPSGADSDGAKIMREIRPPRKTKLA